MRERFKCPECGLVQWKEDVCKRCEFPCDHEELPSSSWPEHEEEPLAPLVEAVVSKAKSSGPSPLLGRGAILVLVVGVLLWGLFKIRNTWLSSSDQAYMGQLTFQSLNELCPFDTGTFICQHTREIDGRLTTLHSKTNADPLRVRFGRGQLSVQSPTARVGFKVTSEGFDDDITLFLFSGGRELDFSGEENGANGSLRIEAGDPNCRPKAARVYRAGFTATDRLATLMADVVMNCDQGTRTVSRICIGCKNVLQIAEGPKPPPEKDKKALTLGQIDGECSDHKPKFHDAETASRFHKLSKICILAQDDVTKKIVVTREDDARIEFGGDPTTSLFVAGSKIRIQLSALDANSLSSGLYQGPEVLARLAEKKRKKDEVVDPGKYQKRDARQENHRRRMADQVALMRFDAPGCSYPQPQQFRLYLKRDRLEKITFEVKCAGSRRIFGQAIQMKDSDR